MLTIRKLQRTKALALPFHGEAIFRQPIESGAMTHYYMRKLSICLVTAHFQRDCGGRETVIDAMTLVVTIWNRDSVIQPLKKREEPSQNLFLFSANTYVGELSLTIYCGFTRCSFSMRSHFPSPRPVCICVGWVIASTSDLWCLPPTESRMKGEKCLLAVLLSFWTQTQWPRKWLLQTIFAMTNSAWVTECSELICSVATIMSSPHSCATLLTSLTSPARGVELRLGWFSASTMSVTL